MSGQERGAIGSQFEQAVEQGQQGEKIGLSSPLDLSVSDRGPRLVTAERPLGPSEGERAQTGPGAPVAEAVVLVDQGVEIVGRAP